MNAKEVNSKYKLRKYNVIYETYLSFRANRIAAFGEETLDRTSSRSTPSFLSTDPKCRTAEGTQSNSKRRPSFGKMVFGGVVTGNGQKLSSDA